LLKPLSKHTQEHSGCQQATSIFSVSSTLRKTQHPLVGSDESMIRIYTIALLVGGSLPPTSKAEILPLPSFDCHLL
jgi:hypothetical protein